MLASFFVLGTRLHIEQSSTCLCTGYAFATGTKGALHRHDAKEGIYAKMLELVL